MSKDNVAVKDPEVASYRLSKGVVPERYEIHLAPDLGNQTFTGSEEILVKVVEPTDHILLNAIELDIQNATLIQNGEEFKAKIALDAENERLSLTFNKLVKTGNATLKIDFAGAINDKLHGFYRSTSKLSDGTTRTIACTQFEPTDARRAFPCWDEPDFKATFKIALTVDKNLTAISNTAVESEKAVGSDKKEISFKETMKMSTYIVAYVVGDFEGTAPKMVDGTPVRIWAPPGKLHLTKFAEQSASTALAFFNKYYGIPYPSDKLDFIAIPDFAFGAMENLGCVTFRENALLVDENTASHAELERVADVIAHEIAHMWFGNLATMKWWNGLWLNEAFASFMQIIAVDDWKPEWRHWETLGVSRANAMTTDGLLSTRPIEFPVRRPEEAEAMFDVLTYEKGASVLRMLEQYLGPDVYRKGINKYLTTHKHSNTETTDLFEAIETVAEQPVKTMMDTWIFQEGYPLVRVKRESPNVLKLEQERFLYRRKEAPQEFSDEKQREKLSLRFHVPIMLRAKTEKGYVNKKVLLTEATTTVSFDSPVEWVVVNEGGHGYYRAHYSAELLEKLLTLLPESFKNVTDNAEGKPWLLAIERFNLLNDMWAGVLAGLLDVDAYFGLLECFKEETDKNAWTVILGSLTYIERVVGPNEQAKSKFAKQVRDLLSAQVQRLGYEPAQGEDALTGQLRGMILSAAGVLGEDKEVLEKVKPLFERYKKDRTSIHKDVAPAVISILAAHGDETLYEEFEKLHKSAESPQEEDRYMYAFANFKSPKLLTKTMEKTINGEVRTQNAPFLARSVMYNVHGRDLAWQFVKKNWSTMHKMFPTVSIHRMCEGVTALIEEPLLKDVEEFFARNAPKQAAKTIEQHIEKLKIAVALKKRSIDL